MYKSEILIKYKRTKWTPSRKALHLFPQGIIKKLKENVEPNSLFAYGQLANVRAENTTKSDHLNTENNSLTVPKHLYFFKIRNTTLWSSHISKNNPSNLFCQSGKN